jgi:hypothetical protein
MINTYKRVEVPNKTTQAPSTKKRGEQKPLKKITFQKSNQERRRLKLLKRPRKRINMWLIDTM